ncbi:DNA-binding protein [Streptomyces albireticuli]|uniref:DNA-binding protein n=1 Tax=Streptomyces albireticuli TaxID=1940 RepID=A0A2A2D5F5_9ACTN|nr:DNA-binding protein [Streptomyces albireticuli]MCD9196060.1 DNA-binding protein [Streptomyces albireticuli]PAU46550.1 DNA-binding protein [Streptomyces albireticuli]
MTSEPLLVTEDMAAEYTGRPGVTIRRWAHEGRIHRHGSGRGRVRYDLWSLPRKTRDELTGEITPGAPPPLPEGRRAA